MKLIDLVKRLETLGVDPVLYCGKSGDPDWMSLFAYVPEHKPEGAKELTKRENLICFGLHADGTLRDNDAGIEAKLAKAMPKLRDYLDVVARDEAEARRWMPSSQAARKKSATS